MDVVGRILGTVGIALLLGIGEINSQTDWLEEPEIQTVEWEPIPQEQEEEVKPVEPEDKNTGMIRTHDDEMIKEWWMLDHGDDPDIPNDIEEAGIIAGNMYNICPELLYSIGYTESRYNVNAKRGSCRGWLQVSIYWHAWRFAELGLDAVKDWDDLYANAIIAAWYLSDLAEKYDGDVPAALMEYNGDSYGLSRYWKTGKASYYATDILTRSAEMERRHEK